jgi:hypothetical protein
MVQAMRLPAFLRFLAPRLDTWKAESLGAYGHLRVVRAAHGRSDVVYDGKNFLLDQGLTATRDVLIGASGGGRSGSIFRMAIGDGGCPAGQLFSPKQPDVTWPSRTGLYHEVLRQDVSVFDRPTAFSMRFTSSFNSAEVDVSSYSLASRVVNEAALIFGDGVLAVGGDKRQINKVPADLADSDEVAVSVRTFKSTSFEPTDNVVLTVTWTLSVVR